MTIRGHPENVRNYGVHLVSEDHIAMWKRVSERDTVPSRYPHVLPLTTSVILEDFWALCNVGDENGFARMFQGRWPSYRRLTLEFLSTLKVHKNCRSCIPERIEFRLGNRSRSFSMDECEVFKCFDPTAGEEIDYDYSDVWGAFTIDEEEFESGYAKSTSIRNPVLSYLHRAMTQLMFARVDGGGVSQTELDIMWCLLTKRGINFGVLFTTYVDRISMKDESTICCRGLITAIAEHVEFQPRTLLRTWEKCKSPTRCCFQWDF